MIFGKEVVKPNFGGWKKNKTNAYSKILDLSKYYLFLFHPPGYLVAAQAIKSIYEKMTLQDEAFLIHMTCLVLNVNALHQGFLIHVTHLVNVLHIYV